MTITSPAAPFVYVEADIPQGVTLSQWRRRPVPEAVKHPLRDALRDLVHPRALRPRFAT